MEIGIQITTILVNTLKSKRSLAMNKASIPN